MAAHLDSENLTEVHEINVTPFIDVMLVLLIIFMVAAPLATVDVPVDLPSSSAKPAQRPAEPLFVTVGADARIRLGDADVPLADLAAALDGQTHADKDARIYLRADKSVDYATLMKVLDALRDGGYLKVALVGLENAG